VCDISIHEEKPHWKTGSNSAERVSSVHVSLCDVSAAEDLDTTDDKALHLREVTLFVLICLHALPRIRLPTRPSALTAAIRWLAPFVVPLAPFAYLRYVMSASEPVACVR
jgi:hypothetical protein